MKKAEVWKTSDGEMFDNEEMAYQHEKYLIVSKRLSKVAENLWNYKKHAIVEFAFDDFREKIISGYETLKHTIDDIENDLEELRGEDTEDAQ